MYLIIFSLFIKKFFFFLEVTEIIALGAVHYMYGSPGNLLFLALSISFGVSLPSPPPLPAQPDDVYQSFQEAVKFLVPVMIPNSVCNTMPFFLFSISWLLPQAVTFWCFNILPNSPFTLWHVQNVDLPTSCGTWGGKMNVRKKTWGRYAKTF